MKSIPEQFTEKMKWIMYDNPDDPMPDDVIVCFNPDDMMYVGTDTFYPLNAEWTEQKPLTDDRDEGFKKE